MKRKKTVENNQKIVGAAMSRDLIDRLDALAKRNRVTRSKMIRIAVSALTENRQGEPT
ncbi:MAG: ribbon-helix-helix protein, CopG family [Azospirillum sp.]|nr:ribbon-helix-helix protein, CopG family [Azospirillum sp.]MCA3265867.1 ribbon-helix-helix protein, CopG family [Azospirillum sp.]